jgi:hypothetical protein
VGAPRSKQSELAAGTVPDDSKHLKRRLLQLAGYGTKLACAGFRVWQSLPTEAKNAILRILGLP